MILSGPLLTYFKGNPALKKAAVDRLMKNADEIAVFVSSANPNLPRGTVFGLLLTHGQQHMMSIDATAKKDWTGKRTCGTRWLSTFT